MDELIYGVWKGRVYDNRRTIDGEVPDSLPIEEFSMFNPGNPVAGFVGPQGFLVFDTRVTLADILWHYYHRTRELSCGRCTPCRAGSVLIDEALDKARHGEGHTVDWDRVLLIAEHMAETSLCGIGISTPAALIGALTHFRSLVADAPAIPDSGRDFYSVATAPCIEACPAHVNVPRYIDYIRDGHPELATGVLLEHYPLVGSCGRVCVRPCEGACVRTEIDRPVAIRDLKRYAADHTGSTIENLFSHEPPHRLTPVSKRVAVVGAGPAGITCAYHLLRFGHQVDIFEEQGGAGGMARLGIPMYRLPNNFLDTETGVIEKMGGQYFYHQRLGRDFSIDSLFKRGYEAVFLAMGCALGQYLGLPNEDTEAQGYLKGLDFLLDIEKAQRNGQTPELHGDVVVVGCGNVAMDCCRSARRMVKEGNVIVSYRRTRASAPADQEEIDAALDEGIRFEFLTAPQRILVENGKVVGLEVIRMRETEPDATGRRAVVPIEGSEFVIPCSYVIAAIGQKLDPDVLSPDDGVALTRRGTIAVDDALQTTRPGVFAGGDATAGPTTLIHGMAQGQQAAKSIDEYLMTLDTGFIARRRMGELIAQGQLLAECHAERPLPVKARAEMARLSAQERAQNWDEVEQGLTQDQAWAEASRCMRCYRLFGVSTLKHIPGNTAMERV